MVLTGLLIPFAGTSLGAACLFFVRDTMNINLCMLNRRYFRLFRYTLDRGVIEVNVGIEVRLDKPKTRISYADTRVFVGGVREI